MNGPAGISIPAQAKIISTDPTDSAISIRAQNLQLAGSITAKNADKNAEVLIFANDAEMVVEASKTAGHFSFTPADLSHIHTDALSLGASNGLHINTPLDLTDSRQLVLFSSEAVNVNQSITITPAVGTSHTRISSPETVFGANGAIKSDSIFFQSQHLDFSAAAKGSVAKQGGFVTVVSNYVNLGDVGAISLGNHGHVIFTTFAKDKGLRVVAQRGSSNDLELLSSQVLAMSSGTLGLGSYDETYGRGNVQLLTPLDLSGKFSRLNLSTGCVNGSQCGSVTQSPDANLSVNELSIASYGAVTLNHPNNKVDTLSILTKEKGGNIRFVNDKALTVGTGQYSNIQSGGGNVNLSLSAGHTLTLAYGIQAGTGNIHLQADQLLLGTEAQLTGSNLHISPASANRPITLGSSTCQIAPCLAVSDLFRADVASLTLGASDQSSGAIHVAGFQGNGSSAQNHHNNTQRLNLISNSSISQSGAIEVNQLGVLAAGAVSLNQVNQVGSLAGRSGSGFQFKNQGHLNISDLAASASAASETGLTTLAGNIDLDTANGNLTLVSPMTALAGDIKLNASGKISGDALVSALGLEANAGQGIQLNTRIAQLSASDSGNQSNIQISNQGALHITKLDQAAGGNISIDNLGAIMQTGVVETTSGNITLHAHSPLRIDGKVVSRAGGNISLIAGANGSSEDKLILDMHALVSSSGNVSLQAGDEIILRPGSHLSPGASLQAYGNGPPVIPPLPSLESCIANPAANNCSSVLPTLANCISNPSAAGCGVVLPSLATCAVTPSAPGCQVVLPSLATCISNPNAASCGAVLPSVATCAVTPSTPGCQVVLPSLATCISNPSTIGCGVVLPSLATCAVTPSAPGCQVVLPSLASCISNPSAIACGVVLPSLATCAVTPSAPGCQVVLPSLASCISNPSAVACGVVLPSLATCAVTPSAPGCQVVLPSLASCISNPSATACAVVLPSLANCISNPSATACGVVLPSLATCTVRPSAPGCQVVLPSLASCISNPSAAACGVVLPNLATCSVTPSAPGCQVVLPSLANCISNPSAATCGVVLPNLTTCSVTPSTPGCQVVLPSLASCINNPSAAACGVVLPNLATCSVKPNTQGCQVVLPRLEECIGNSNLPACGAVLPSLANCSANPLQVGCAKFQAVLDLCISNPESDQCKTVTQSNQAGNVINSAMKQIIELGNTQQTRQTISTSKAGVMDDKIDHRQAQKSENDTVPVKRKPIFDKKLYCD